ncbi:hypothetical protein pW4_119 [Bacillus phage pW4]|uniref:Uncharacterized protein n=1 Tax=Bacillus phage pW4 TaxID=2500560 RepID=A0A3Q9R7R5_9CAUD|nr:hypothetical protein PP656_gp026 [Bacillus phage pW4]AZU99128.1 hypothetical protein pW4_119 [Bacillus phage pW4]
MDYIKCSEKELTALETIVNALESFHNVSTDENDINHDLEVNNEHDLNGLAYDIKNNDLFENWVKFNKGETKVTAYDAVNGTGAQIIEILHNNYDKVFGYYEEDGEKIFFVSEQKDNYNDETGNDEPYFFVGNTPVGMHECLRVQ